MKSRKTTTILAGPCSAETESQVINTAKAIAAELPNAIYRAGIWKPRTKPGHFEGVGIEGLAWMQAAKQESGLRIATEVANAKHVEQALKYGFDVLWIGARTSVNPFSVQDIADALQGVRGVELMVKNPVNPDLELWIGAIQRLQRVGCEKISAIHRGFSVNGCSQYRNQPLFQIPLQLREKMPEIPIICDPSHICGNRNGLEKIARQALELGFEGLMIETHPDPDKAWSDAAQQITPERLFALLEAVCKPSEINELGQLREQISMIDEQVISLMATRMNIAEKIGDFKRERRIGILQKDRWKDVLETAVNKGVNSGLSRDFVLRLLKTVHRESINRQQRILEY